MNKKDNKNSTRNSKNLKDESNSLNWDTNESEVEINEVPIEEIMKNPEKYKDKDDAQEEVLYCKHCLDYTIFVNNVCTVCGNSKSSLKNRLNQEDSEETSYQPDILSAGFVEDELLLNGLVDERNSDDYED